EETNPIAPPSLLKDANSSCTRYTRLTLSIKRMRINMNVIYSIGLVSIKILVQCRSPLTFNPYCNFATTGLSEMKVNNFRLMGKGRGMIKPMKTAISKTRRQKTYTQEAMVSIQIL